MQKNDVICCDWYLPGLWIDMFKLIVPFLFAIRLFAISPFDSDVQIGELENGLKYYIRENQYPKERAYLALVLRVGSLNESEKERGIAHFIEHLNFRGGKHFQDGEVISYLESIGSWLGKDTNAYTSCDSTVYTLDIPLDKKDTLDKSMLILRDFAGNAILLDETIEKERHVVLDELHHFHSSAIFKLNKKFLGTFLPETACCDRFPIGEKEIISTIEPHALRAFYDKWYRADRMAVIAVGDFDAQEVKQKIHDLFDSVPSSNVTLAEPDIGKITSEAPKTLIHFDPELPYTRLALNSFFPAKKVDPNPEILVRQQVITDLLKGCFKKRALKLHDSGQLLNMCCRECPIIPGLIDLCYCEAVIYNDSPEEGIKAFYKEFCSILKHGFIEEDLNFARNELLRKCEKWQQNLNKICHSTLNKRCMRHFLYKDPLFSSIWETEKWMELAQILTLEECNAAMKASHYHEPLHTLFTTSNLEHYEKISQDTLENIFKSKVLDTEIEEKYFQNSFTCRDPLDVGSLTEEKQEGFDVWTLNNEMKVYALQTEHQHDQIILNLQSDKGDWDLPNQNFDSAKICAKYLFYSGLNSLSYTEFVSFLKSHGIEMRFSVNSEGTKISLSSSQANLEIVFQIVHELFQTLKFDRSKWSFLMNQEKERLRQNEINPDRAFYIERMKKLTQNHPYFQPFNPNAADPEKAEELASYFFGRAQDFTAIIVGDFDETLTKNLTKKYLASLPIISNNAFPKIDIPPLFPKETLYSEFSMGHHTYETILVDIPLENIQIDKTHAKMICKLLSKRLREVLRQQMGGTYSPIALIQAPFNEVLIHIRFTCQRKDREALLNATFQEIEKLKNETCSDAELNKLKVFLLKDLKQDVLNNRYWADQLYSISKKNRPLQTLAEFENRINDVTVESLRKTASQLFASPYQSVMIHVPEES